jgi:glucosylceramidase
VRRLAFGGVAALVACSCSAPRTRVPRDVDPAARGVEVYVTTGDRSQLLQRQNDLRADGADSTAATTIRVDPNDRMQEMVGFGASLTDASAWLLQNRMTAAQRESLLRDLFGPEPGAGFSFVRLDMGASDFSLRHYSYDDVPPGETDVTLSRFSIEADRAETIPIIRRALAINPRLRVMASPWSAPAWMKTSGSMITGTLRDDAFAPYAEYFRRFIVAYAAEGIPMFAVTVQNEPHYEPADYPGMRLEPSARARFIGQHLGPMLERSGIDTRILDWDHNWDEPDSPLRVLSDSAARRYVSGVAWHCYGGDVGAQRMVRDAHPDKDVYFTECSGGAWAPDFGDNLVWTVKHLIIGSTRGWPRGVLMWNLALDEKHGPHLGGCGNCRGVVTIDSRSGAVTRNEEYYAFAHASRFVRPGAHRIASTAAADSLESVAFRNADDGSMVLIVLNPTARSRQFVMRSDDDSFAYMMPARAVATFRWR